MPAQVSSTSLDHGSKLRGPLPKSPGVAEQCDVNIQSINQSSPNYHTTPEPTNAAVGSLVVRASDSRPEDLGLMLDVTKYPPSAHGFTCRNCGGGDRGRVAIYRPFGEVSLSLNRTVTCMVLKANDRRTSCPCHDEFRGPRSDYVRQLLGDATTTNIAVNFDYFCEFIDIFDDGPACARLVFKNYHTHLEEEYANYRKPPEARIVRHNDESIRLIDCLLTSHCLATRGLLATDLVILNHGQVTWTAPELAPPLLTTTPHQWEDFSALDRFNVHRCPARQVFIGTGLELVTRQAKVRYLYHSATAAVKTRVWKYPRNLESPRVSSPGFGDDSKMMVME
ncbi:uncharacterized protein TNCV_3437401 [Trichonephila clavipes]|nr:uncharacterized protein TNCV_3437401 [Trichonephila clavipes]